MGILSAFQPVRQTMIFPRPFLLSALCVLFASALAAEEQTTIEVAEIAAQNCGPEWSRVLELDPDAWAALPTVTIDPGLDPEVTRIYNKHAASLAAMAEYIGLFIAFGHVENQTLAAFEQARARFDLTMCLSLTTAEREVLLDFMRTLPDIPEDADLNAFFIGQDKFNCMRFPEASRALFARVPEFPIDMVGIAEEYLVACG
ncbi:MAG: hypothetical protein OIF48_09780 [Silicimonas sp.]|nr:hypothetical protein [Silicimonas sp.]